jgi:cell division protein FtsA
LRSPQIKVLGVGRARTTGLRRGVVADIEETMRSIRKAMEDAERMAGQHVTEVYVGIAGEHVQAMTSTGVVAVNGEEISRADVERANDVARAQAVPTDSAGVYGRQESRDSGSGWHDRDAARDRDVPRDDRGVAGDESA